MCTHTLNRVKALVPRLFVRGCFFLIHRKNFCQTFFSFIIRFLLYITLSPLSVSQYDIAVVVVVVAALLRYYGVFEPLDEWIMSTLRSVSTRS
jgi:hypothetical protein